MTFQTGPTIQSQSPEGLINLAIGQPSPSLLPLKTIGEAAARRLGPDRDRLILQYGAIRGLEPFREDLARFLTTRSGHPVAPEELLIGSGNSLSLSMVCEVFGRRRGVVVCEDPTYFLARGIFRTAGLDVVGIPTDEHGLSVEALEERLETGLTPDLVYVIPSFHNPTSVDLAPERSRRLVELADRHDFLVVADEPYPLLHFGSSPPPGMSSFDGGTGRVISLGSFSKILAPGLRLGWIHARPDRIETLAGHGALASGGGLVPIVSSLVHETIETGFLDRHLDRLRATYRSRATALTQALAARIPGARFHPPEGGYFVWLRLPEGSGSTTSLREAARAHDVRFTPGPLCSIERNLDDHVRLSFAFHVEAELELGIERLAAAIAASTP